jgi:hypothetical protein
MLLHIEQIVRPIRASMPRKLRIRRELLAHLQSAYDEEKSRGLDDQPALQNALTRLGNPKELTDQLQRSIPPIHRLLFSKLSTPAIDNWERTTAKRLYGGPITLLQFAALFPAPTVLTLAPGTISLYSRTHILGHGLNPSSPALFFLGTLMIGLLTCLTLFRPTLAAADPTRPLKPLALPAWAALLIFLQLAFVFFINATAFQRLPGFLEIALNLASIVLVFPISILIARKVASFREPYLEWSQLEPLLLK